MTAILLALTAAAVAAALSGGCTAGYYPTFSLPEQSAAYTVCRISFTLLAALPVAAELADRLKWKYLLAKI